MSDTDKDCDAILRSMYLYLDKEQLTDDERSHVKEHLDECIPCLESFEFEVEFKQLVKSKCCDSVPVEVYQSIKSKILVEMQSESIEKE